MQQVVAIHSYPTVQLEALLLSNYDLEPANQPFSISPSSHSHLPPLTTDFNKVNFGDSSGAGSWCACLLRLVWLHLIICIDCRGVGWLTSVHTSPRLVWKWSWIFPYCLPQFPSWSCAVVGTLNWDSAPGSETDSSLTPGLTSPGFSLRDN